MEIVQGMEAFVRAAETRSFTQAAKLLGVTSSGVGKAVSRLEAEVGVRLLHRTTRRVALTDEGALFLEHCRRVLEEVDRARAALADRGVVPRGRVKVSVPRFVGIELLVASLPAFAEAHPDVSLDLGFTDRRVNLVEEGVDLAVRVGPLGDASFVSRRLGEVDVVTVAAPALLARRPVASFSDLAFVPSVAFRMPTSGRERPWSYTLEGRHVEWSPRAQIVLDGGEAMVEAAAAGLGVTQVPDMIAARALAEGRVVEVLVAHRPRPLPIHALYPATRALAPRTRAFLDHLLALRGWSARERGRRRKRD